MGKILVTGAAGFIGFNICKCLIQNGFNVIGIDNLNSFVYSARHKYNRLKTLGFQVDDLEKGNVISIDNMEFHRLDLEDAAAIRALILDIDFDIVIHASGLCNEGYSDKSPYVYIKNNTLSFVNVIDAIKEKSADIRPIFMFLSDLKALTCFDDKVETFNPKEHTYSIYTASKAIEKSLATTYAKGFGLKAIALDLATIYGEYDRVDGFVYKVATDVFKNENSLEYDLQADLVYIDDVTDFLVSLVKKLLDKDNIHADNYTEFKIASGKIVSRNELLQIVHKMILKLDDGEKPKTDIMSYVKVIDDLETCNCPLSFRSKISFVDGFCKALPWYLKR